MYEVHGFTIASLRPAGSNHNVDYRIHVCRQNKLMRWSLHAATNTMDSLDNCKDKISSRVENKSGYATLN